MYSLRKKNNKNKKKRIQITCTVELCLKLLTYGIYLRHFIQVIVGGPYRSGKACIFTNFIIKIMVIIRNSQ